MLVCAVISFDMLRRLHVLSHFLVPGRNLKLGASQVFLVHSLRHGVDAVWDVADLLREGFNR